MRAWLLLVTFSGTLAQSNVVPALSVGGVTPDVPLILTVFVALRRGPETGCLVGFAAGFLQDVAGGGLLGLQAFTKALAGFTMGLLVGRLWVSKPMVQVPGLVLLTLGEGLVRFMILQLFHFPSSLGEVMAHVILPQALYNGFIGAACTLTLAAAETVRGRAWS